MKQENIIHKLLKKLSKRRKSPKSVKKHKKSHAPPPSIKKIHLKSRKMKGKSPSPLDLNNVQISNVKTQMFYYSPKKHQPKTNLYPLYNITKSQPLRPQRRPKSPSPFDLN